MGNSGAGARAARANPDLRRFILGHLMAVISEWGVFVPTLVYAFDRGGSKDTGLASVAMLIPYFAFAPFTATLLHRGRPHRVRLYGMAAQAIGFGIASIAAFRDAPTFVVVCGCMIGFGAVTTIRPSGAVLLPAIVRTSRELSLANVRVGICDSLAVLAGPLVATGFLAIDGPALALAASALLAAAAATSTWIGPHAEVSVPLAPDADQEGAIDHLVASIRALRARPGVGGVLAVAGGQYALIGALDVIVVVAARDRLNLGATGTGLLSTLVGAGSVAIGLASSALLSRRRLAPLLLVALGMISIGSIVFGVTISLITAVIVLPILGLCRASLDLLSRMLLQRSAPPNQLSAVFAVLEMCSGAGMVIGSLVAQLLIGLSGVRAALVGLGVLFAVISASTWRSLRHADDGATVPVVAMSLLRRLPVFAPLPPLALESLARGAVEVPAEPGQTIISQGDHGDRFYAIADGTFDVHVGAALVHSLGRGGSFGEVALLADVPRTATVVSTASGSLLAIDRVPFLLTVTGHDHSRLAAWGVVRSFALEVDVAESAIASNE